MLQIIIECFEMVSNIISCEFIACLDMFGFLPNLELWIPYVLQKYFKNYKNQPKSCFEKYYVYKYQKYGAQNENVGKGGCRKS